MRLTTQMTISISKFVPQIRCGMDIEPVPAHQINKLMRNSRNGNGRSLRSSRQSSDQHDSNDYRNRDTGSGYQGRYDRNDRGSQDQDYYDRYDRSGIRNQSYGGDYEHDSRNEYGNNSYTDNEGYRGGVNRYSGAGYDQDDEGRGRQGGSGRWPESGENWGSSRQGATGGMNRGYGRENRSYGDRFGDASGSYSGNYGSEVFGGQSGSGWYEGSRGTDRGVSSFDYNRGQSWGHAVESMRGKGPKGYRRSDERVLEELNDRFTDDHELDASSIEVTVKNGEVTLSGTVQKRQDKRRAEDIAESISGVNNVENRIRVSSSSGSSSPSSERSEGRESQESEKSKTGQSKNRAHQNAEV